MEVVHMARLVPAQVKKYGNRTALRFRDYNLQKWTDISWKAFGESIDRLASSLIEDGYTGGTKIGLFSQNKPECLIVDFAVYSVRSTGVPMYATSTTSQIEYIIKDAGIELIFVGEQYQYDRAYEALTNNVGLKQIVIFDTAVRLALTDDKSLYFADYLQKGYIKGHSETLSKLRAEADEKDLANILYTSGTSGESKGVLLTHEMFSDAVRVNDLKLSFLSENEISLSFLPMTHIFEKAWDAFSLSKGIRLDINLKPLDIQMTLKEVRPTCMCCVPRFWEKIHAGVNEKISTKPLFLQLMFKRALSVGKSYHLDYLRVGSRPPFRLSFLYLFYKLLFFNKIKRTIGLDKGRLFPVAGARLSDELFVFFRSIGIPIVVGYGLTESTATVTCHDPIDYHIGTVGTLVDGLQLKLGPDNEILLKGKTITPGYYNKPEVNAVSFTEDGYFRTGDAGALDSDGHLIITDRIKDLFKTSNGKYIAPQLIETSLCSDKYIDMVAVIGDGKKYVTALIVPAFTMLPELAVSLGINGVDTKDILKDNRVYEFFENRIRMIQKNMAGFEQIKKFALLDEPFTMEKGELTNTLKMRRKVIIEHYSGVIDGLY